MPSNLIKIGSRHVAHVMDLIGQPAFLLDVDGPGKFRFAHINKQHVLETGIDGATFLGCAPHDVLPERLADTVVANYERCRAGACVETYEEQLELSSQTRWWRTTLSPICRANSGGAVTQIMGTAADITDMKTREMKLTKALSAQMAAGEGIRTFAANAMLDSQGPMRAVLAWLDILRDGFVDLGDGKLDEMDRVQQLAIDAIVGMDDVLHSDGFLHHGPQINVSIDLAHMCRDIAALVDPDRRLAIRLPSDVIEADWAVTQIVLQCFLEQATRRAVSAVSVSVEQAGSNKVAFTITDDSAFEKGRKDWMGDISTTASMIKERGGDLSMSSSLDAGVIVRVTLPGHLRQPAHDQRPVTTSAFHAHS